MPRSVGGIYKYTFKSCPLAPPPHSSAAGVPAYFFNTSIAATVSASAAVPITASASGAQNGE